MCRDSELSKAKDCAYRLLAIRPRSIKETEERLKRKGFDRGLITGVVNLLMNLGYLNDYQFASSWVNSRISTRPVGLLKLDYELKNKGIEKKIIQDVLGKLKGTYDEYKVASDLAEKRMKRFAKKVDRLKAKRRIFDYLQRRGFPYNIVCEVVADLRG